jgi:hypothetical protein
MTTTPAWARRGLYLLGTDQEHDRDLVARLRDGDWSALDVLYGRYARTVFQHCWRILRERRMSWETTQDTFATFLVHLPCRCGKPTREWLLDTGTRLATRVQHERRPSR